VSTADQNPQLQLAALATEDCLKVHTDRASGTKADRPQWTACLADLRPGDTLVIWRSSAGQHHLIALAVLEGSGCVAGLERRLCRLGEDRNTRSRSA
jgi:Resolvase, N terminal domain